MLVRIICRIWGSLIIHKLHNSLSFERKTIFFKCCSLLQLNPARVLDYIKVGEASALAVYSAFSKDTCAWLCRQVIDFHKPGFPKYTDNFGGIGQTSVVEVEVSQLIPPSF